MSHEVFDTLNLIRELQAQYAASRAQQHFVPAPQSGLEHPFHWCGMHRLDPVYTISISNQAV
jgi:hypothetical protein